MLKNVVILCGVDNIFKDFIMDIDGCIANVGSCLLKKLAISAFLFVIKEVNRILEHLCSKHGFSFINQSNGWTLPNDDLSLSLIFRDSVHLIEEGNVVLAKLIIDSITLTNNICFSSNADKRYSCSDACKNKVPVSFALH